MLSFVKIFCLALVCLSLFVNCSIKAKYPSAKNQKRQRRNKKLGLSKRIPVFLPEHFSDDEKGTVSIDINLLQKMRWLMAGIVKSCFQHAPRLVFKAHEDLVLPTHFQVDYKESNAMALYELKEAESVLHKLPKAFPASRRNNSDMGGNSLTPAKHSNRYRNHLYLKTFYFDSRNIGIGAMTLPARLNPDEYLQESFINAMAVFARIPECILMMKCLLQEYFEEMGLAFGLEAVLFLSHQYNYAKGLAAALMIDSSDHYNPITDRKFHDEIVQEEHFFLYLKVIMYYMPPETIKNLNHFVLTKVESFGGTIIYTQTLSKAEWKEIQWEGSKIEAMILPKTRQNGTKMPFPSYILLIESKEEQFSDQLVFLSAIFAMQHAEEPAKFALAQFKMSYSSQETFRDDNSYTCIRLYRRADIPDPFASKDNQQ